MEMKSSEDSEVDTTTSAWGGKEPPLEQRWEIRLQLQEVRYQRTTWHPDLFSLEALGDRDSLIYLGSVDHGWHM